MNRSRVTAAAPARSGLEVRELSHRFGDRLVVDHVALGVEPGAVHCLVGPSGCGKTTTLRLIAGLEALQQGKVALMAGCWPSRGTACRRNGGASG